MNTSGHKVAINLDDRFKKLPDSIFRHDPNLIKLLVEWKDNKSLTDMNITEFKQV